MHLAGLSKPLPFPPLPPPRRGSSPPTLSMTSTVPQLSQVTPPPPQPQSAQFGSVTASSSAKVSPSFGVLCKDTVQVQGLGPQLRKKEKRGTPKVPEKILLKASDCSMKMSSVRPEPTQTPEIRQSTQEMIELTDLLCCYDDVSFPSSSTKEFISEAKPPQPQSMSRPRSRPRSAEEIESKGYVVHRKILAPTKDAKMESNKAQETVPDVSKPDKISAMLVGGSSPVRTRGAALKKSKKAAPVSWRKVGETPIIKHRSYGAEDEEVLGDAMWSADLDDDGLKVNLLQEERIMMYDDVKGEYYFEEAETYDTILPARGQRCFNMLQSACYHGIPPPLPKPQPVYSGLSSPLPSVVQSKCVIKEIKDKGKEPTVAELEKLMELSEVFEDFDSEDIDYKELDNMFGINTKQVIDILKDAGLRSLGKQAFKDVVCLLLAVICALVVKQLYPDWFEDFLHPSPKIPDLWKEHIITIKEMLTLTNNKYPSLYSRLELGSTWENVARKMLEHEKVEIYV